MPGMEFVEPDARFRESYVDAIREFHAIDTDRPPFSRHEISEIESPEAFAAFVARLHASKLPETPRPDWKVPDTTLWWVDGDHFIGRLGIRHRLTPALRSVGGHIGYDVRPTRRREGHASRMLAAALPIAAGLGLGQVLLTCDVDNLASRKVIETNGGVLFEEDNGKRRYWITL
jgi:predicted acetyltransferase